MGKIRKRDKIVVIHLSDEELNYLNNNVAQTGLCRESYLRALIYRIRPRASPPVDYYQFKKELSAIGNNINQVAHVANAIGCIDSMRYFEETQKYRDLVNRLLEAVEIPEEGGNPYYGSH